jgi:membrane-associated protease RseP (regulator of RpoE activity)
MLAAHLARRAVRPEQSVGGLARVGLETHDPDALWTRAERLAGEDRRVTLVRATIAPDALPALGALATGAPRAHVGQLGPLAGVQVASADPGSLPALLGLRAGDVVTAIDGIPLRHPDDVKRALAVSTLARGVVIELRRGAQWVVLRLDAMHA